MSESFVCACSHSSKLERQRSLSTDLLRKQPRHDVHASNHSHRGRSPEFWRPLHLLHSQLLGSWDILVLHWTWDCFLLRWAGNLSSGRQWHLFFHITLGWQERSKYGLGGLRLELAWERKRERKRERKIFKIQDSRFLRLSHSLLEVSLITLPWTPWLQVDPSMDSEESHSLWIHNLLFSSFSA